MEESENVTEAMAHAYVASNLTALVESEMQRHIADLLTDVWTSAILALVQSRRTYAEMCGRPDL